MSDETTRRAPREDARASSVAEQLAVTILAHPQIDRVGDVRTSAAGLLELTRKAPSFVSRTGRELPLADAFVSRKPLTIALVGETLHLRNAPDGMVVRVEGQPLRGALALASSVLDEGLVLELADRVAVLVHRRVPLTLPRPDDLAIVGDAQALDEVRASIQAVAPLGANVLVRGESGTGKELVARALAALGGPDRPFVAVNVAALPAALALSELFGHARGAFTGAHRDHIGAFERADGGTLFLDEIGDAPADVQVMLLRALETGEISPLGAPRPRPVSVRVIAATDADVESELASGAFKSALLHRLSGFRIDLPPLRRRRDDLGRLLHRFLAEELRAVGVQVWPGSDEHPWLSASVVAELARYGWPGNVRQLRNVARQIAIRFRAQPRVGLEPIASSLPGFSPHASGGSATPSIAASAGAPSSTQPPSVRAPSASDAHRAPEPGEARRASDLGEDELVRALEEHGFRLGPVARALGVSRPALYDRIERSERVRKARDLSEPEIRVALETHEGDSTRAAEELRVSPRGLTLRMRELGMR
ncbi:MAG: sigma 54-interacting transcriptional regulator [Sandaracinus sp.]